MKKYCVSNCSHNVIHALSHVLDALWRYDAYVKDSCDNDCRVLWKKLSELDRKKKELLVAVLEKKAKKGELR
jgi:hypothetical protein